MSDKLSIDQDRLRAERDALLYERMVEQFVNRWAPKRGKDYGYEHDRFVAELTGIVRQTILDTQRGFNEQLMAAMRMSLDSAFFASKLFDPGHTGQKG